LEQEHNRNISCFTALSQMYESEGSNKKYSRHDLLFDFEFFQQLSQEDFVKSLIFGVNQYIQLLKPKQDTGI